MKVRVATDLSTMPSKAPPCAQCNSRREGSGRVPSNERISIDNGCHPGDRKQRGLEESPWGGGLRTILVAIEYGQLIERLAPAAWMINFTNPAGLITQALSHCTGVRGESGICDTSDKANCSIASAQS